MCEDSNAPPFHTPSLLSTYARLLFLSVLQFLFLNTLLPAAGSATTTFFAGAAAAFAAGAFAAVDLVAIGPVAFLVLVALSVVFPFPTAFFVITVVALDVAVQLEAAEWLLTWLSGRSGCCGCCCSSSVAAAARRGGGAILPLSFAEAAAAAVAAFSLEAVRLRPAAALPAPRLACSTIP